MKRQLFSAATILALCLSGNLARAADLSPEAIERAAIIKAEEGVAYATTVEAGLAYFDPDIIQDDFFPPQRRGVAEVRKDFDVYMANYSDFRAKILDITVDLQGDLAVAYSHQSFIAKGKDGAPDLDAVVRQTDVLRKKNGKWLITYQHLSVPVDLKTGLAAWKPS
jgi:ketosteroid isomerase-like protein